MTTPKDEAQESSDKPEFDAIPIFQIVDVREMEDGAGKAKPNRDSKAAKKSEDADDGESRSRIESSAAESFDENRPFGYSVMIKLANSIEICTSDDGFNSGRSFYLKASAARH
jgi:hypothetical protein